MHYKGLMVNAGEKAKDDPKGWFFVVRRARYRVKNFRLFMGDRPIIFGHGFGFDNLYLPEKILERLSCRYRSIT